MFHVQRHYRTLPNDTKIRSGDIYHMSSIHQVVELIPRFESKYTEGQLDAHTSLEDCDDFYINHFENKETFLSILSYQ